MRVDVRRIAAIKEGERIIGNHTRAKIVKNKLAAPFREAEFDLIYGEGISRETDLLDLAVAHGMVEKSGAWFTFENERIGQGRENARQFLRENRDVYTKLDRLLRQKLGFPVPAAAPAEAAEEPEKAAKAKSR